MKRQQHRYRKETPVALLFLAPSLTGFLLFFIIPFGAVAYYSLIDNPIRGRFVGLGNYGALWASGSFRKAFANSLLFTAVGVPLVSLVSLGLAMLLKKAFPFQQLFRTIFLLPLVVPVASVILVWQALFHWNGALNSMVAGWGLGPVDWMNTQWAFWVMLGVFIWKNAGYNLVVFLAGLANIADELYESASLDGAGKWQQFRHITWPGLMPATFFVIVMSMVQSFRIFRETYLVAGAYPHDAIYTLQHFMNNMFQSLDYPKLTAAAVLLALVIGLMVYGLFLAERKSREALEA